MGFVATIVNEMLIYNTHVQYYPLDNTMNMTIYHRHQILIRTNLSVHILNHKTLRMYQITCYTH